jgi:hypothetical protein
MARFTTASITPPSPRPGAHLARIVKAKERVSGNGNPMLLMTARFPGDEELGFVITFVAAAAKLVSNFCRSIELELPQGDGVEVEIRPGDVLGRYFYPLVEADEDGTPRITRFLSKSEALAINPGLATVKLEPQTPRSLKPIGGML